MRPITVIGSVNMDLVVTAEHLPREGETVLGHGFSVVPGGKGANQAVAAARLGADVRFVGCVGDDDYGKAGRDNLARHGVDVQALRTVKDHTGVALIMLDRQGRNLIAVAQGANRQTVPCGPCDIAVMQLETPYVRPDARLLILNAAPVRDIPLDGVDVLIINAVEAEQLSGRREPTEAAKVLRQRGAKRVLITLGKSGVYDGTYHPAFPVEVVDTVGAGDAFVGGFAAAVALDRPDPVRFSQAAAALTCTRFGAQSMPSYDEVNALLSANDQRQKDGPET